MNIKTFIDIKTEILYELALIKDAVNIEEYLDEKYFRTEFIREVKEVVMKGEACKCHLPFVSKAKFGEIILDIILQHKEREDIETAVLSIFNIDYGKKLLN